MQLSQMKYLLIALLFIGCNQRSSEKHTVFGYKFREAKSNFPDSITNHFPPDFDRNLANYSITYSTNNTELKLLVHEKPSPDIIDTLIHYYEQRSIAEYSAADSCLFVINRFAHYTSTGKLYNQPSSKMQRSSNCSTKYLPIPNFYNFEYHTRSTISQLDSSYRHYVLAAHKITTTEPSQNWERFLPEDWKNSQSHGVSISSKEHRIIYCVLKW